MLSEQLRHFLAAARTLHFTRAAEQVYRSQSAISQSIATLEARMGQALFFREGRKLRLTPAGEQVLAHGERMAAAEQQCIIDLDNLQELRSGNVCIGSSATTASYYLPPFIARFKAAYPGIKLQLLNGSSETLAGYVQDGTCDLALLALPVLRSDISTRLLFAREDVLICAPGSPLLKCRPPCLEDLQGIPFLMPDSSAQTRFFLDDLFKTHQISVCTVLEIRGLETIKRYTELDAGVSIVPRLSVCREVEAGSLEAWPLFEPKDFRQIALAIPSLRPTSRAAEAFMEMLS